MNKPKSLQYRFNNIASHPIGGAYSNEKNYCIFFLFSFFASFFTQPGGCFVMPRGMSRCRICGKPVPSVYRRWHEKVLCLKMRFDRGDANDVARVLSKALPLPVKLKLDKPLKNWSLESGATETSMCCLWLFPLSDLRLQKMLVLKRLVMTVLGRDHSFLLERLKR